jgi:tetratricopeptide (TPR) repeat protein
MPGSRGAAPLLHVQAKIKNEEEEENHENHVAEDDLLSTSITPSSADDDVPNLASSEEKAAVPPPTKEDAINLSTENEGSQPRIPLQVNRPHNHRLKGPQQQHSERDELSPTARKTKVHANAEAYAEAGPDVSLPVSDAPFGTASQQPSPGTPLTPAWLAAERSVINAPDGRSHRRPSSHLLADTTASDASATLPAPWASAHYAAAGLDGTTLLSLNTTAARMDDVPPLEELEAWLASRGERLSARALTSLGAGLIQHGRYEQAADVLQGVVDDVLAGVRARPQEGGLGDTLFNLGVALVGCERMAEAAEAHRRALGCYRREGDEAGLLLAATNGTGALLAQEKYREALDVALPALQRWELRVASQQVAASELAFGVADRTRGRAQSRNASLYDSRHANGSTSLSASLNGSLALSEAVPEDGELLCYCYIFAAQAMFKLEMPEEAAELALSALEVMPRVAAMAKPDDTGSGILEARLRHSLGAFYNAAGRFEDALPQHSAALTYYLAALDEAEAQLDAARSPKGRWVGPDEAAVHDASRHVATLAASAAAVADNVGFALCMVGDVESAVGELERGLALWETAGEPALALHTHERLAAAQRLLGRDDLAAYHLEAALRIAEALYIDETQVRLAPLLQAIWEDLAAGELGAVVASSEVRIRCLAEEEGRVGRKGKWDGRKEGGGDRSCCYGVVSEPHLVRRHAFPRRVALSRSRRNPSTRCRTGTLNTMMSPLQCTKEVASTVHATAVFVTRRRTHSPFALVFPTRPRGTTVRRRRRRRGRFRFPAHAMLAKQRCVETEETQRGHRTAARAIWRTMRQRTSRATTWRPRQRGRRRTKGKGGLGRWRTSNGVPKHPGLWPRLRRRPGPRRGRGLGGRPSVTACSHRDHTPTKS